MSSPQEISHLTQRLFDELPATGPSLWAGLIAAPSLWSLDLVVRYAVVPLACANGGDQTLLHALSAAFLLAAIACTAICYADWRRAGLRVPGGDEPSPASCRQFVAATGLLSSALFSLVIVAEALPGFFISPCVD